MAWSGKLVGGLLGGMLGGPLGAGVGAAVGHYLGDTEGASRGRELVILRLAWRHHAFGPSGPGVRVTPVWRARRHEGRDCRVRVDGGSVREVVTVVPDTDDELVELPEVLIPYAGFEGGVRVRLDSPRVTADSADFELELPTPVKRLGSGGPARMVMALVACARAGERPLGREDVRFIRETFTAAHPLDDDGIDWLRAWLRELRAADLGRLTPEKVATRVSRHVEDAGADELLLWLMRGTREAWPGGAAEGWIAAFGESLGRDAAAISALWTELDAAADPEGDADARRVLGVSADADADTIRAAWRALVQAWHPDRHPHDAAEATRRMSEINAAYRVLRQ